MVRLVFVKMRRNTTSMSELTLAAGLVGIILDTLSLQAAGQMKDLF
jgi:hypothetical protein